MPSRPLKVDRAADPTVRYDRYRISMATKGQKPGSEAHKFLTIAALTAMLADARNKSPTKGGTDSKDWDVCHIKFTPANGKSKVKPGSEIFRKVDSNLLWIDNPKQCR
ncbi:hypothetical protein TWF718_002024 [Orbilia javanica]|uniref:Uncharacterized protein n=1 Tax=Orbilia javanica TaxID=47235 RepID=A0AAN8P354_9PEZI